MKIHIKFKGGPGSGHHGHVGRPGKRGGSLPGDGYPIANPDGIDTYEQYRNSDGTWTKERQALHDKIVAHFFEGATPVDNPVSYVLGGGPAAGKSTLINMGHADIPENHVLAAGDDIKEMLPEYIGSNAPFVHEESSYLSKVIASKAAKDNYNVVMDGTGDSDVASLAKKIKSMSPNGQPVIGKYVFVEIETALQRAISRAQATGRFMPPSISKQIHTMVSKIFPAILAENMYTNVDLYYTGSKTPIHVVQEIGNSFTILDQGLWDMFVAIGQN